MLAVPWLVMAIVDAGDNPDGIDACTLGLENCAIHGPRAAIRDARLNSVAKPAADKEKNAPEDIKAEGYTDDEAEEPAAKRSKPEQPKDS